MVVAPAGTPPAIVQRVNTEINKAMKTPVIAERLHALALIPVFETPEQFAAGLKKARGSWSDFIRRNNIVVQQ
jgi:tripartite-type tricarboxylate transporter receptor subunit TctC